MRDASRGATISQRFACSTCAKAVQSGHQSTPSDGSSSGATSSETVRSGQPSALGGALQGPGAAADLEPLQLEARLRLAALQDPPPVGQVPREFVKNNEIVLNASFDATSGLKLGNDYIEFKARFGGKPRDIMVPVGRVIAIYARENGQGMAFPPPVDLLSTIDEERAQTDDAGAAHEPGSPDATRVVQLVPTEPGPEGEDDPRPPTPVGASRPTLKRVK